MALILDGTNGLSDVDGSAATPAIRGSDANTGVFFGTDIVGVSTGGSERMRVDASGNVGIGTSSPNASALLTVAGNMFCSSGNIFTPINSGVFFSGTPNTFTNGVYSVNTNDVAINTNGAERARINSSGDLLVGTTSVFAKLSVLSPSNAGAYVLGSGSVITARNEQTAGNGICYLGDRVAEGYMGYWVVNGALVGSIYSTASTTAYNTSSDYRLKHDIQPMTGALAKVAALKPVTYKWNADDSESQGFIAHELQEVVPECVTGEKDAVDAEGNPQYQGIDTSFLVATLTAAIQEQQAIITALTARVEALEGAQA